MQKVGRNDPCPCGSGKKYKQCCGLALQVDAPAAHSTDDAFRIAQEHLQAGQLQMAEPLLRQVLASQPGHAEALHASGVIALQLGRHHEAVAFIERAAQVNPANPVFHFNLGMTHLHRGSLEQAAACYRKVLQLSPDEIDALSNLAFVLKKLGHIDEAIACYRRAIALKPQHPEALNNLGNALKDQGKLDEAIACYRNILGFMPGYLLTHINLGNALMDQGKLEEAVACYRQAIALKPDHAEAHSCLGNALKDLRRLDEAITSFQKSIALKPDAADVYNNLGIVLADQGKTGEAIVCYRRALSFKPNHAAAYSNLGIALSAQRKLGEAALAFGQAITLAPDNVDAHYNLGNALSDLNRLDEAAASYRKALALKPDHADAQNNLGNVLKDVGRLDDAMACYRNVIAAAPDYVPAWTNLFFAMVFDPARPPAEFFAEHQRYSKRFETPLRDKLQPHANTREPGRKLRIGYVSPDFRNHSVAYFIEPVFAHHDKNQIETFCYYNHAQNDDASKRLAAHADHWLNCVRMSDDELAAQIRADGIDILVDLAGHTAGNRLQVFARKPAPIQITWLGYPGSSWLTAMDYRLTDDHADPDGAEGYYVEKLLKLPDSLWCYRPAGDSAEITPLPALQNGYVTFGSFSNFNKVDHNSIALWAQLLRELPASRLVIAGVPEGESRAPLLAQFASLGVPAERIEVIGRISIGEFRKTLERIDIALDPVAINSPTTMCETLWMGIPTVSQYGMRCSSRAGLSILHAAGFPEFAGATEDDYMKIAKQLAENVVDLSGLRMRMRTKMAASPLTDEATFTRNLENAYRAVWTNWCVT